MIFRGPTRRHRRRHDVHRKMIPSEPVLGATACDCIPYQEAIHPRLVVPPLASASISRSSQRMMQRAALTSKGSMLAR